MSNAGKPSLHLPQKNPILSRPVKLICRQATMKHLLIVVLWAMAFIPALSQSDTTYHFKEVGMSVKVPSKFQIVSAEEDEKIRSRGKQAMETANHVEVDASATINLLSIQKGQFNYLNITATPFGTVPEETWKVVNKQVKDAVYKTFADKVTPEKLDTASSSVKIDGVLMDKFEMKIRITEAVSMKMVMLSKLYKGFDFGISYVYMNDAIGDEIEKIVYGSKFKK
jgi:hypothetical protein